MRYSVIASAVIIAGFACFAGPSLESEAVRASKGALLLQVGSDWCVSGEEVRSVFESPEFKRFSGGQFVLGIFDDADSPTPAINSKNDAARSLLIRTKRFPAITCYTPGPEMKVYAQIENVPQNVDPKKLWGAIQKVTAKRKKAEELFKKAASSKNPEEAADLYGQGFDLLASMMGPFHFKELTEGAHGWRKEWDELVKLDAGDKYGWLAHFRMDEYETVALVEKVTNLKTDGARSQADSLVSKTKAIPQKHFTANQKQCVKIMEYALNSDGSGGSLSSANKALLKEAFALGRDTLWGQFAMGRLKMDGENIESKGLYHAKVLPRPAPGKGGVPPTFALDQAKNAIKNIKPGAALNDQQKLAIARYACLRLIGFQGWQKLAARPGAVQFMKAFLNDREWMEDFAWSGTFPVSSEDGYSDSVDPGAGAGAILALESLIYQDKGRWVGYSNGKYEDNEGRRFMTALAINYPNKDEEWLADVLDAYRNTALSGRLHKSAYSQPVWLWRFALHQGHRTAGCDNMAAQQRHLDKFINIPQRELGGTPWMIVYRLKNCFGDSVHGPLYYKAWETAGEWPKRKYSQMVGGVCGELSKFGSAICNSKGLPSSTVGQPGHCAYSRRRSTDGYWEIDYNVTGHSQMHLTFWNHHEWQYVAAIETTFSADRETRLAADRILTLATLAEDEKSDAKKIESFHQHACAAHPGHYGAWKEYGDWLMRANLPLDKIRIWVRGCARGLKAGRQPLWNILTPYFKRVAIDKGAGGLKDELIAFAPLLKQAPSKLQEEADFQTNLVTWTEALGNDRQARYDVLKAMLVAQYGTSDYFSQVMGWGSEYFTKSPEGSQLFTKCMNEALAEAAKGSKGAKGAKQTESGKIDFGPMILAASRNANIEAFRNIVNMQRKMGTPKFQAGAWPKNDFTGELLSEQGLLRTSSTSGHEHPENYAYGIDTSACTEFAFHTDKEDAPWAIVMLPGPAEIKGIVIENNTSGYNQTRQIPMEIAISDDGKTWNTVKTEQAAQKTYRIDLRSTSPRAQYVRVSRTKGAKNEFFHLNKILVYGKKYW
ncbi:MAG: discoidin domain-containing protein [Kiritimatiellae bacterium]|nr:discoidin domain-containing protein [Kiritimatiellia bacterium]